MKLSEAIRKGAKIRPQAFGYFFHVINSVIHSCGMGAAFEGAGIYNPEQLPMPCHLEDKASLFDGIPENWPDMESRFKCPICEYDYPPPGMVAHLNDSHLWPRETIADWLEERGY